MELRGCTAVGGREHIRRGSDSPNRQTRPLHACGD